MQQPKRSRLGRHTRLAACTALRTVGDAVRIGRAVEAAPQGAAWEHWVQTHLTPLRTPLEAARARAVLDFWQRAQGFAELGVPRHG